MTGEVYTFLSAHWLDLLSTVLGLVYIVLEYRASIALWFVGIIMPAIDIWLFWSVGLYADFGMAIYYTLAGLYGYLVWRLGRKRGQCDGGSLPITHFKRSLVAPATVAFLAAWAAIYVVLVLFTDSDVPVTDSFINALSIIGMWALARKYVEQWLIWIVIDAFCAVLFAYKGIPFKAGLYALYVLIAVFGYLKWKREAALSSLLQNSEASDHERITTQNTAAQTLPPSKGTGGGPAFDAVILCDGDFPTHPVPLGILRNARYVCCCDGASAALVAHGITPDAIVGDGDSLTDDLRERFAGILNILDEQDDNDQTKATRHCAALGFKNIAYLGATGKREDHTLGNIALLAKYRDEMGINATMVTDYGYFVATNGDCRLDTFPRQQVSIFNLGCTELRSEGLRWEVYPFTAWWQGTLNEATGEAVLLRANGPLIVYRTFEGKQ